MTGFGSMRVSGTEWCEQIIFNALVTRGVASGPPPPQPPRTASPDLSCTRHVAGAAPSNLSYLLESNQIGFEELKVQFYEFKVQFPSDCFYMHHGCNTVLASDFQTG